MTNYQSRRTFLRLTSRTLWRRTNARLTTEVETYFGDLGRLRASGGATGERSTYPPLTALLNAVGATLKPKVFCVSELADHGAGHPDLGLYAARQVQRRRVREGQVPERGVIEVKSADDDAWLTAGSDQVSRYRGRYRLVLVTNTRDFVLVGEDAEGLPAKLESFRLAGSAQEFERLLQTPRAFARRVGAGLGEYLCRALSHRAALAEPKDLAWLLASYARDGLARVEAAGDAPSLAAVRSALEQALGVRFEGERGAAFFRSTLVQTLFYGVFSAWVLWARRTPLPAGAFDWRTARLAPARSGAAGAVPAAFRSRPPATAGPCRGAGLDRRRARSRGPDRVLQPLRRGQGRPHTSMSRSCKPFDPALRKQLGVWYTATEVVRYMVARVDHALRDDLGIADGLAADNVYVLDPCCGTGAYLGETLRRIARNLEGQGLGALTGARVKQAALERVFGFEIMPAPFVVAHLQVGLTMQALDAPLADDGEERAGVFLTNALTGWEPTVQKPLAVSRIGGRARPRPTGETGHAGPRHPGQPALQRLCRHGRGRGARAFAGPTAGPGGCGGPRGRDSTTSTSASFRMAERRIVEKTGQGVVCFISNYSWLDGLSFTGMREPLPGGV